ncbi:hypothetical protein, partial [Thiolapillus sp.]|uniref:hypothetical protein n=1 Tax=Thiolapillus sp. TaxID=2017437 RepID=UPI003AF4AC87
MNTQNQIKRRLSTATGIEYIKHLLNGNAIAHRTDLAKQVCSIFNFHVALPETQRKVSGVKSPRRLTESVPLPVAVPDEVNAIAALELVPVQDTEQMRIW